MQTFVLCCCCPCLYGFLACVEIDVNARSSRDTMAPEPCLMSAAWCVALRMLDVVAHFAFKGEWRADHIDKWKEAFQVLDAVGKGTPPLVVKRQPGTCLFVVYWTLHSFLILVFPVRSLCFISGARNDRIQREVTVKQHQTSGTVGSL